MPERRARGGRAALVALVALGAPVVALRAVPAGAVHARPPLGDRAEGGSCPAPATVASWSTQRLATATVVVPAEVTDLGAVSSAARSGVGGVVLFGDNPPAALGADLRATLASAPAPGPLVMVDEEGGSVQRLPSLVGSMPSARQMAATMSPGAIEALAETTGRRLRALGVDVDLAPVLDLDAGPGPSASDADGTRSFSASAPVATRDALAFANGLLAAAVLPVLKHFPGLGGATANTDVAPASTKPYRGLGTPGLQPFSAGVHAGFPAVMVANAAVPGLSAQPASVSGAVITGLLRHDLGFSGLVLTDALSAPSLTERGYGLDVASLDAVRAGADEVLFNADPGAVDADVAGIVAALVGAVSAHHLARSRLVAAVDHAMAARVRIGAC